MLVIFTIGENDDFRKKVTFPYLNRGKKERESLKRLETDLSKKDEELSALDKMLPKGQTDKHCDSLSS